MWYSILITVLTAYLLGNLNGSVCISQIVAHEDIRSHGSGNAGLTNFFRTYGSWSTLLVLIIDANDGVTEQDTKIAGLVHEAGKAAIIVVNKWDAVENKETNTMRDMERNVREGISYMTYAPVVFLSALTGQRVDKLYQVIQDVHAQNTSRITTGALNSVLADATARVQPPTDKGRRLKIYYMTQASTKPPHFVIFCNDARLFHFSYQRYLENQIREVFGLQGTPVRITIRQKGDKEED